MTRKRADVSYVEYRVETDVALDSKVHGCRSLEAALAGIPDDIRRREQPGLPRDQV
jgi:hypothetical protein